MGCFILVRSCATHAAMSIWVRIGDLVARVSSGALSSVVETVRTAFEGDPETRRRVAFSVAMIALSAKMAKADGIVTPSEVTAFQQIFAVPEKEAGNVSRLYRLAMTDTAGYEQYAERMARLCGSGEMNCPLLEDILDGLFFIAKADGVLHDKEVVFLRRISEIFDFDQLHFDRILVRHANIGDRDPFAILGVSREDSFETIRRAYRKLALENHPDRLMARGVPEEFIAIANDRIAVINSAYAMIEKHRVKQ